MAATTIEFPGGDSWSLYFHDPADSSWSPDSYKKIGSFTDFASLWSTFYHIGYDRMSDGMYFMMRDPFPPLWENKVNIRGGTYCLKVPDARALGTYDHCIAAAILGCLTKSATNKIVGISISPKKSFHIIKVWNNDCKTHKNPDDLVSIPSVDSKTIIYRPHVDQKF